MSSELIGTLIAWFLVALLGATCLDYAVDTLLTLTGKEPNFPFLVALLFCMVPKVWKISVLAAMGAFTATFFV